VAAEGSPMAKLTKADVRFAFETGFEWGFGMYGSGKVNARSSDEEYCRAVDAAWTDFNWGDPQKPMKRTHLGGQPLAAQAIKLPEFAEIDALFAGRPEQEGRRFALRSREQRRSKKAKSAAAGK
jgi:hypothetical protein